MARAHLKRLLRVGAGHEETEHNRPIRNSRLGKRSYNQPGGALPASSKLQLEGLVRESLETITIVPHERSQF